MTGGCASCPPPATRAVAALAARARGVNGYTLDDTGTQPQNNVTGTIWWDDIQLTEPESTAAELAARGVKAPHEPAPAGRPHVSKLDLGERLLGKNVLEAELVNPGPAGTFGLRWEFTAPSGKKTTWDSPPRQVQAGGRAAIAIPYVLEETCPGATPSIAGG